MNDDSRLKLQIGGMQVVSGWTADVFCDYQAHLAYKVFRVLNFCRHPLYGEQCDRFFVRRMYASQCEAYRLIATSSLKKYVPSHFKPRHLSAVLDAKGKDVSYRYVMECCYQMELLDGMESKVRDEYELASLVGDMKSIGLNYVEDSSCIRDRDGNPRLIDFAMERMWTQYARLCQA